MFTRLLTCSMKQMEPLTAATAALITAGAQGANMLSQGSMNRKTRKWNEKMYEKQRQDNLSDWHMMAAYNSPAQQMARLKAAGLNPNLVYGNGANAEMGQAPKSSDMASWSPKAPEFDSGSILASYQNARMTDAQVDNMQVQRDLMNAEKALKDAQKIRELFSVKAGQQDYQQKSELFPFLLEAQKASIAKLIQDTKASEANTQFTLDSNARAQAMQSKNLEEATERIAAIKIGRELTAEQKREIGERINKMGVEKQILEEQLKIWQTGANPNDSFFTKKLAEFIDWIIAPKPDSKSFLSELFNPVPKGNERKGRNYVNSGVNR